MTRVQEQIKFITQEFTEHKNVYKYDFADNCQVWRRTKRYLTVQFQRLDRVMTISCKAFPFT